MKNKIKIAYILLIKIITFRIHVFKDIDPICKILNSYSWVNTDTILQNVHRDPIFPISILCFRADIDPVSKTFLPLKLRDVHLIFVLSGGH